MLDATVPATDSAADLVSAEVEQALLGALLIRNNLHEQVVEIVRPGDFAIPVHGRIYSAIGTAIEHRELADAVTLKPMFDQDNALASRGSGAYLALLMNSAVTFVNVPNLRKSAGLLSVGRWLPPAEISLKIPSGLTPIDRYATFSNPLIRI